MRSNDLHKFWPLLLLTIGTSIFVSGCGTKENAEGEAPPPANVVAGVDVTDFAVEHPEQYPIVAATAYQAPSQLVVNGTVLPDISRTVPVISLASGRVV